MYFGNLSFDPGDAVHFNTAPPHNSTKNIASNVFQTTIKIANFSLKTELIEQNKSCETKDKLQIKYIKPSFECFVCLFYGLF